MAARNQVLRIYKQILRLGKTWTASTGQKSDTLAEQKYIKLEAQSLFRKNQKISDPKVIQDCIHEAQARMELAVHYKTPYPRPVNVPPQSMAMKKGKQQGSTQERLKKQSIPVYIKSHFER